MWHEALSRQRGSAFDAAAVSGSSSSANAPAGSAAGSAPAFSERRLLEYVVLGDLQTAVAFLLASPPEPTARYYRDAAMTMALAAAAASAGRI